MAGGIDGAAVAAAMRRVAAALEARKDTLTELDQAVGDGDLGITASKAGQALAAYADQEPGEDLGKYVAQAGMAVNRVASSTMGTLLATALMRAGKAASGKAALEPGDLAAMLRAADQGIQERGKAKPGDKTVVDALHPAAEAFAAAIEAGAPLQEAARRMAEAARRGMDEVTPLRNRIGRAGWVGERTEGRVDPGCAAMVAILEALADQEA
ncbi:dihydroxyacetone kinase subunit L [Arenibaculum pallidiluteum]|uniref:dihydroxyacetone kinase subunit L n=1 Tax=Arenibaculum pallidiluteum TaxID=2812559 RepID=UPI001A95C8C3|nr:dihydroxyacetone kinase subunit L [Arenibaculum pallidiluteum]